MAHYAVHFTGPGGAIIGLTDVIVPNDGAAIQVMHSLLGPFDMELWHYERRVAWLSGSRITPD